METALRQRGAAEVFDDHLRLRLCGEVEEDLRRNYAPDVAMLIHDGVFHGHDGVRHLCQRLSRDLPNARFSYTTRLADGDVCFLEWTAQSDRGEVQDGVDSFVMRDGRIVAQTIHYTVT